MRGQRSRFAHQAVGAGLQLAQLVRAPPAVELHPCEPARDDHKEQDEDLGRAAQLRRLPRDFGPEADAGTLPRGRLKDFPRRRGPFRETLRGGRRREVGIRFDDRELERRPVGPESNDVALAQQRVTRDALAVHERPVAAAQILQDEPFGLAYDRRVPGRDVEVTLGVEADVRQRMAAKPDVTLAERFDLPRAGSGEKLELGFHLFRMKYQSSAAATAISASTTARVCF